MRRQYDKTNGYDNRPQQNIYPAAGGRVADGGGEGNCRRMNIK